MSLPKDKYNILVVDDDPGVYAVIKKVIASLKIDNLTVHADDGQIAINKMRIQEFDLVILDFRLPKMNGKEIVEHMRVTEKAKYGKIPILFISGQLLEGDVKNIVLMGIRHILVKPFTPPDLIAKIKTLLALDK